MEMMEMSSLESLKYQIVHLLRRNIRNSSTEVLKEMCLSVALRLSHHLIYFLTLYDHRYTYGKPVPGLVNVQVCRKFSHSASNCYGKEAEAVCEEFTRQVSPKIKR